MFALFNWSSADIFDTNIIQSKYEFLFPFSIYTEQQKKGILNLALNYAFFI